MTSRAHRDPPCSTGRPHRVTRTRRLPRERARERGSVNINIGCAWRGVGWVRTWQQLSGTRGTAKTLDVKDFRLGSHHKIIFAKGVTAFITFCTK